MNNNDFTWVLDTQKTYDNRNIPFILFGDNERLPDMCIYNDYRVNHQGLEKATKYACVFYWEANTINEIRYRKKINKLVDWKDIAYRAIEDWVYNAEKGAYLIDWPKISKRMGLIDWYTVCNSLEDIKQAIYLNWPVWVGSNQVNWSETNKNNFIVVKWKSYGHKFIIVWYDDLLKTFTCENSYWKSVFDNWRFYLKYDDLDLLFQTKTSNFINDDRFLKLDKFKNLAHSMKFDKYYEYVLKPQDNNLDKMLSRLAMQMIYVWKVNTKSLLQYIEI